MPLDPQIGALLTMIEQAGAPPISEGTAAQAREAFDLMFVMMRDPSTLAPVRSVEDATIPGPRGEIPVRIYRPDVEGPVPTMAFFHGGGFVIGNIETHEDQARLICRDGQMVVVSVDYALAPEHQFPAGFEDCLAATQWVAANIDSLGADADKIVVGGDSAGGNLAAAVALATRESGPPLAAQFLIYPATDFRLEGVDYPSREQNATGYFLTKDDTLWFGAQYLPADVDLTDARASVITADLAGAPPAVIGTAEFDPLRDEGEAYAKALADAGVDVRLERYDGMIHGYFGLGAVSPAAAAAVQAMIAALRELLT